MKQKSVRKASAVAQTLLGDTMLGAQEGADAFVTDWQLPVPREVTVKSGQISRSRIVTLGTSVLDVSLHAEVEANGGGQLYVETPTGRLTVRCIGKPPFWGEKGHADADLSAFAAVPGAQIFSGGGVTHSTRQLAEYHRGNRLGFTIHAIDTNHPSPRVAAELAELGAEYAPLGLASAAINLVLSNAHIPPQRLVLRSPVAPPTTLDDKVSVLDLMLRPDTLALLLNSPKSTDAAAYAVARAKSVGIRIYTVLNPSLPMPFRLERLQSPDEACVCNLLEFAEIAAALGIFCPGEEIQSSVAAVAQAISKIGRVKPGGDICVTLGELGCVAADASTGGIYHLGLTPHAREEVRVSLRPEQINGSGDRFFAVFAAEHARFQGDHTRNSRTLLAARRASLEVVRSYGQQLRPNRDWFGVRIFAVRFER